jgi:hypothetical protein
MKNKTKLFAILTAVSSSAWAEFPNPDYQCHTIQHMGEPQNIQVYLDYPSRTGSMMVQHQWAQGTINYHGYLKSHEGTLYNKSEFALHPYHLNQSLTIVTSPITSACGRGSCDGAGEKKQNVSAQLLVGVTKINFVCNVSKY